MVSKSKVETFVGVSGFSYPSWKGNFYPIDLKSEQFLEYYSKKLTSVEINSSFYATPNAAMIRSWHGRTGDAFRFSVKAPRQITHVLKLGSGSAEAALRLEENLELLGTKRGPILFQLPPFLRQDLKLLESFLEKTGSIKNGVFEFRHQSWLSDPTYELLSKYGAGFCVSETEDMEPVLKVTGRFSYVRLRRDSYDKKAIDNWIKKIRELNVGVDESYIYLRHDESGENARRALELQEKI
ncbi:MAG TPA: DUF72 domain-containing protein [Candidatus Bathyarchaeia archaeon]|nr:DUF72 domain-containing protein [Candidatus Bathyarchaeia archaeon]